ncbi:unnamed protein product [Peronospora effusa]|nr:unnamed protein product [Peronospora effusa]
MASSSPDASSSQTTSTRSIITLDGYISSGKAPTSSEVLRDHAMLQDFVAYLELRLKSQNLSMLRRIFADFLNEHEYTLIPMMHQGCTIITIFPVERTSARRRRQAEFLLSKPKFHLNFSRGCVFLYLQYRTATRNMALLKHLFLEFIGQRETSLLAFVERGCQVISVIPFELPRIAPPARLLPPQLEQRASPCAVENVAGQEQTTSEVAGVEKTKKNEVAVSNTRQRQSSTARADVAEQQPSEQRPEERRSHSVVKTRIEPPAAVVLNGSEIVTRRRQKRTIVASTAGSSCSRDNKATNVPLNSNDAAVLTLKRGRTITPGTVSPQQQPTTVEEQDEGNVPTEVSTTETLPTFMPNETSSTATPGNATGRRSKHAGVASNNESGDSKVDETINVPWNSSPTAILALQHGETLTSGAVPLQRKSTAVVDQDEQNVPIEALASKRMQTEASPTAAWSNEALVDTTKCHNKRTGVASTNEAASNKVWQDKNAPTAGSTLNCSKTSKANYVLPRHDLVAAAVDQAEVMSNDIVPAFSGDLAIETSSTEAVTSELEISTNRRLKCVDDAQSDEANREEKVTPFLNPAAELTPTQGRNPEAGDVPPQQPPASEQREASPAVASPTKAPQTEAPTEVLSDSQPKRRRGRDNVTDEKRSRKRGKPFMTEEMCRNQLDLTRKIGILEAQSPWKTSHGNLPAPFDAERYPELARKFSRFWRKHVHAVWERKFWAPMSRKLCLPAFNKRNNRQLMAKNAFELLIVSVYEEFGAAFFVEIDALKERHPGWWYRGPVVALFALQQIKGEDTMWDYVNNQAFLRFPDCNLPIPLTAANSGAVRIGHKRESESMWMVNHQLTAGILHEIAALKAEKQAHEQELASQITTIEHDRDVENETALVEALELM